MGWIPRALLGFVLCSVGAARVSGSDLSYAQDATLRSAFFIDNKEGWVVGDEGVILHTIDGGASWERQRTSLRSAQRVSLRSVQFLTQFVGWAVGREELPFGMGSTGVILFTSDGGLEWKQQMPNTLPGLNQVRFVDLKNGYFLGDGSAQFPSGVFKTTDSGKSWNPVSGPRTTSWLAGDFQNASNGILGGSWSRLGTVHDDKCTLAQHAINLSGRDVNSLQIVSKNKTFAVAQGGLILLSQSEGAKWGYANTKWPTELLANLDFHSLCAVKNNLWIVGRPGSVVVHSPDAGSTWNFYKTGQSLPLHGVFFFDEKLGWAVGDAGTILRTSDGGKTWKVQHQAGNRAAGLCIHARNQDVPVDTLALLGAAEGYLMTALRITAPDPATIAWGRAVDARRFANAMRHAGALTGETFWHFPLPQYLEDADKTAILAHWNKLHANFAEEELLRQLVLTLRIWRPSIVISEHPDSKNSLSSLVGLAVQKAVQRAADAKAYPEQIQELGLEPWQVRKVYGSTNGKDATLTQENDDPQLRLEGTVRDYAVAAHSLLTDAYTSLPQQRRYQCLSNADGKITTERHWMQGLDHKEGETKRAVGAETTNEKLLQTIMHRRNAIAQAENLDNPGRTLALVPIALEQLPEEHAAPAAFAIASRFAERGQWYLAQEVYLYMLDRYPYHPLATEACRWLIRLNNSGEARRRNDLKHFAIADRLGIARKKEAPGAKEANPIVRVGKEEKQDFLCNREEVRDWNKGSLELIKLLDGFGSVHALDPATQFSVQTARRKLGGNGTPREWLTNFREYVPAGPWHESANAELWLTNRAPVAQRRIGRSRYTEVRPFLDGKFDDPCWQDWKPMILDDAVGQSMSTYATEAMFAFDQEFLYVALKCQHPSGKSFPPVKPPRGPDADLDAFDRVSILLDIDRDYATYYHLEVDQRGCVRDSCWGDRTWNPRWYVAVHSTDTCWQIEAAIPLSELTSTRLTQSTAWAFNLVRIVPKRGVQSWSQPADVRPCPEGMSLLMFQMGAARPMKEP